MSRSGDLKMGMVSSGPYIGNQTNIKNHANQVFEVLQSGHNVCLNPNRNEILLRSL